MTTIPKDASLTALAARGANVAQFASWAPDGSARHSCIRGHALGARFTDAESAVRAIHATMAAPNVNIRTFLLDRPDGNPFLYGPKHGFHSVDAAAAALKGLLAQGYHAIVNETIDENDGGFSGVLHGDRLEFASRDIPRCVEKPGCAALPRATAQALTHTIYRTDLPALFPEHWRIELSVHPVRVGWRGEQYVLWQADEQPAHLAPIAPRIQWPNRYSRDMGDKAYGLLMAHLHGHPVPRTRVFGRVIPPFTFGADTGNGGELWLRTCPREQLPGKFTTVRGWMDPFALMHAEDPDGSRIAAVLAQDGVRAQYSGAAATDANGALVCEGSAGFGDGFMQGSGAAEALPANVRTAVTERWNALRTQLGDVRFEWAYDGETVWVVQLHVGHLAGSGETIVPGEPIAWLEFNPTTGLDDLRDLVEHARRSARGIIVHGHVGVTSHVGDILRRAGIPSRLKKD